MSEQPLHWAVTVDWRNRSLSFAATFVIATIHLAQSSANTREWAVTAFIFLLWPQLAYLRARYAANPLKTELQNLLIDCLMFGAWTTYWGLPLWISFMLLVCGTVNQAIYEGRRGFLRSLAALALGMALAMLYGNFSFRPDTSLLVSSLCMVVMSTYFLIIALYSYRRGVALRKSRERLQTTVAEISSLQAQLQYQATHDALTGLNNRRQFDLDARAAIEALANTATPLSLLMADIDHFKSINDTHGHLVGDAVIQHAATTFNDNVTGEIQAYRYGGEEFVVIMPNTDAQAARRFAEQLRQAFARPRTYLEGAPFAATLSFGIASIPEHANNLVDLLQATDAALYQAKQAGRNRCVMATPRAQRSEGSEYA